MEASTNRIGAAVRGAREYLRDHADEARYTDSAATARLDGDGLGVIVSGPGGISISTDMPASVGGKDSAPSPGWVMRAAHAACVATLTAMRAAEEQIVLRSLEVIVDSESDDRGILGAADDVPVGPVATRVRIGLAADGVDDDRLRELAEWGWRHCPVDDAMRRAIPVTVEVDIDP